jgi:protein-S-isoprenylcysteine O-methyltransferase Ste14
MAQKSNTGVNEPGRAKGPSPAGTTLFVLFRALDIPLELFLLRIKSKTSGDSLFGLTPYYACLLAMVITSSARHIFWQLYVSEQAMPVSFAVMVCIFNSSMNAMNIGMSLWGLASNSPGGESSFFWGSWTRSLGLGMFCLGSLVETYSELQRKAFKSQPANKEKVYMGGLFGVARHINYGGYLIWRVGFAIFAGGLPLGAIVFSYFLWYFSNIGVPALDGYCSKRVSNIHPRTLRLK